MTSNDAVRVAFGSPEAPLSGAWRFWVNGSDVYLSIREQGGIWKMSLHESGEWFWAFTRESGIKVTDRPDTRRGKEWTRAPEFKPGWVLAAAISVPRADDKHDLPVLDGVHKFDSVIWLEEPEIGWEVQLVLLFAADQEADPERDLGESGAIVKFDLDNGEALWLMAQKRRMTAEEIRTIVRIRDEEWGQGTLSGTGTGNAAGSVGGPIHWVTTSPKGPPMIVQIGLGEHNWDVKS